MKTQTIFSIVLALITLVFTSCEDAVMEGEKGDFVYLQTLEGHTDIVNSASYSPDGRKIVSASVDKTIKIWDANTGSCLQTLTGHIDSVRSASYSPDGTKIVSASYDNTIKIWSAE